MIVPMSKGFTLFDTALGRCGIAWTERGVAAVRFPEAGEQRMRARLVQGVADAVEMPPPAEVQRAIDLITALIAGENADLSGIALDHERMPAFHQRVYAVARTIAIGETMTYGEIAKRLGDPLLAREVGQALGKNPTPIVMPCHRVLGADGKPGGFSAPGGVTTKLKLLSIERRHSRSRGALFEDDPAFILQAKPRR